MRHPVSTPRAWSELEGDIVKFGVTGFAVSPGALDDTLIAELDAVVDRAIEDSDFAVLHLRSNQRVFSAGADSALIQACFATPQATRSEAKGKHSEPRRRSTLGPALTHRLRSLNFREGPRAEAHFTRRGARDVRWSH